jgi:hypothetical protein
MRSFAELPFSTDESGGGTILPPFIPSGEVVFQPVFPSVGVSTSTETLGTSSNDLLELWKSVTDPSYHRPLIEDTEGGRVVIEGALSMYREASIAIEASTQSLYIRHWSGQTADPARVANIATGQLQFSRVPTESFPAWLPIVFPVKSLPVEHVGLDWSPEGPVEFLSGRRYYVTELSSLGPGELGPLLFPAAAEKAGPSYNEPWPGTINRPDQPGATLNNDALSTAAPTASVNWLVLAPAPDLLSAQQVGQYVELLGQQRRITGYLPPLDSTTGGTALLDTLGVFKVTSVVGSFEIGEEIYQASTSARGMLVSFANGHFGIETSVGVFSSAAIVGSFTSATATITATVRASAIPVATSVSWRVLDWDLDVGLSITNPERFTGGRLPVLEELGSERAIYRTSNEPEEVYRTRVATAGDVVSPNALQRTVNRIISNYGGKACLREVGSEKLPGLFFDVPPDGIAAHAFAFDMDPVVRPGDRWKVLINYTDFRGYFLMGLPWFGLGDFSAYCDEDPGCDSEGYFDGYAVTDAALHSAVYSALVRAKAGGVGFDLYIEQDGCV